MQAKPRRLISFMLALMLIVSLIPVDVIFSESTESNAEETTPTTDTDIGVVTEESELTDELPPPIPTSQSSRIEFMYTNHLLTYFVEVWDNDNLVASDSIYANGSALENIPYGTYTIKVYDVAFDSITDKVLISTIENVVLNTPEGVQFPENSADITNELVLPNMSIGHRCTVSTSYSGTAPLQAELYKNDGTGTYKKLNFWLFPNSPTGPVLMLPGDYRFVLMSNSNPQIYVDEFTVTGGEHITFNLDESPISDAIENNPVLSSDKTRLQFNFGQSDKDVYIELYRWDNLNTPLYVLEPGTTRSDILRENDFNIVAKIGIQSKLDPSKRTIIAQHRIYQSAANFGGITEVDITPLLETFESEVTDADMYVNIQIPTLATDEHSGKFGFLNDVVFHVYDMRTDTIVSDPNTGRPIEVMHQNNHDYVDLDTLQNAQSSTNSAISVYGLKVGEGYVLKPRDYATDEEFRVGSGYLPQNPNTLSFGVSRYKQDILLGAFVKIPTIEKFEIVGMGGANNNLFRVRTKIRDVVHHNEATQRNRISTNFSVQINTRQNPAPVPISYLNPVSYTLYNESEHTFRTLNTPVSVDDLDIEYHYAAMAMDGDFSECTVSIVPTINIPQGNTDLTITVKDASTGLPVSNFEMLPVFHMKNTNTNETHLSSLKSESNNPLVAPTTADVLRTDVAGRVVVPNIDATLLKLGAPLVGTSFASIAPTALTVLMDRRHTFNFVIPTLSPSDLDDATNLDTEPISELLYSSARFKHPLGNHIELILEPKVQVSSQFDVNLNDANTVKIHAQSHLQDLVRKYRYKLRFQLIDPTSRLALAELETDYKTATSTTMDVDTKTDAQGQALEIDKTTWYGLNEGYIILATVLRSSRRGDVEVGKEVQGFAKPTPPTTVITNKPLTVTVIDRDYKQGSVMSEYVSNAKFAVYTYTGTDVGHGTPYQDSNGQAVIITTDASGTAQLQGLVPGKYYLVGVPSTTIDTIDNPNADINTPVPPYMFNIAHSQSPKNGYTFTVESNGTVMGKGFSESSTPNIIAISELVVLVNRTPYLVGEVKDSTQTKRTIRLNIEVPSDVADGGYRTLNLSTTIDHANRMHANTPIDSILTLKPETIRLYLDGERVGNGRIANLSSKQDAIGFTLSLNRGDLQAYRSRWVGDASHPGGLSKSKRGIIDLTGRRQISLELDLEFDASTLVDAPQQFQLDAALVFRKFGGISDRMVAGRIPFELPAGASSLPTMPSTPKKEDTPYIPYTPPTTTNTPNNNTNTPNDNTNPIVPHAPHTETQVTLSSTVRDSVTGLDVLLANKAHTLISEVTYTGLERGKEYVLLFSTEPTGLVEKTYPFTAEQASGTLRIPLSLDVNELGGIILAVKVSIMHGDNYLAQALSNNIYIPSNTTLVKDKTVAITKNATITDTIAYKALKKGEMYLVEGAIVDKETGKVVSTSTTEFRAASETPTIDMVFQLDTMGLRGKEFVVFETTKLKGFDVATHIDKDSIDQSFQVDVGITDKPRTGVAIPDPSVALYVGVVVLVSGIVLLYLWLTQRRNHLNK